MTKKTQRAKARAEKKPRIGEEHIRPDGSVIRYVREEDDDRKPVDHYRTVDTLALMLRNGSITGDDTCAFWVCEVEEVGKGAPLYWGEGNGRRWPTRARWRWALHGCNLLDQVSGKESLAAG